MKRTSFLIIIFVSVFFLRSQEWSFSKVDSTSYSLYQKQAWSELASFIKKAKAQGYDYYYLNMRFAVANMYMRNYLTAKSALLKAKKQNRFDDNLNDLLYRCAWFTGDYQQARTYNSYDTTSLFTLRGLNYGCNMFWSNNETIEIDLDGEANAYGRLLKMNSLKDYGVSFSTLFSRSSLIEVSYNKMYGTGDIYLAYNNNQQAYEYLLDLNQLRISYGNYLGKDIYLDGYGTFSFYDYTYWDAEFDTLTFQYNFLEQSYDSLDFKYNLVQNDSVLIDKVFGLSIEKRWPIFHLGIETGINQISKKYNVQSGIKATLFPAGNYDYLIHASLFSALIDNQLRYNTSLKVLCKLSGHIQFESSLSVGEYKSLSAYNGRFIYNMPDDIRMMYGAGVKFRLADQWRVSLNYNIINRKQTYVTYVIDESNQNNSPLFKSNENVFLYKHQMISLNLNYHL